MSGGACDPTKDDEKCKKQILSGTRKGEKYVST